MFISAQCLGIILGQAGGTYTSVLSRNESEAWAKNILVHKNKYYECYWLWVIRLLYLYLHFIIQFFVIVDYGEK